MLGVSDPVTVDVSPKFAGSGPTPSARCGLLGRDVLPPRGPRQSQHRSSELAPQPGVPWTGLFSRVAEIEGAQQACDATMDTIRTWGPIIRHRAEWGVHSDTEVPTCGDLPSRTSSFDQVWTTERHV